mmetsp:Transcript_4802/g.13430  ORF Transcript_4802/g.13430 Transcript_4802/m.13430 type:complete len:593 (+) Transcript_4802:71-1849(+)
MPTKNRSVRREHHCLGTQHTTMNRTSPTVLILERRTLLAHSMARRRLFRPEQATNLVAYAPPPPQQQHKQQRSFTNSSSDDRNAALVEHEYERIKGSMRDQKNKLKQSLQDKKHQWATTIAGRRSETRSSQGEQTSQQERPLRFRTAVAERFVRTVEGWSEVEPTTTTHQQQQEQIGESAREQSWRGMTPLERAQGFPAAVWDIWQDAAQYQNIVNATRTHRNAWTPAALSEHQQDVAHRLALFLPGSSELHHGDDAQEFQEKSSTSKADAIVPWRQVVQQRQFIEDLTRVIVPLMVWIPPIVGWLPTILAVTAPRQFFTSHFHNEYEKVHFAWINQEQRRVEFPSVIQKLCKQSQHLLWDQYHYRYFSSVEQGDAAGPLLQDPMGLYTAIFESSSPFHRSGLAGIFDLDELPSRYVTRLALAMGLYQSLPGPWMNQFVAKVMVPRVHLRAQLRRLMYRIVEEDSLLLLEGHDQNECQNLSNQEVLDSCLMRNLPIVLVDSGSADAQFNDQKTGGANLGQGPNVVDYQEMRRNLTHHLEIMSSVAEAVSDQVKQQYAFKSENEQAEIAKERLGLFSSHVAILRHSFKNGLWR